jgi:hypothetical protein
MVPLYERAGIKIMQLNFKKNRLPASTSQLVLSVKHVLILFTLGCTMQIFSAGLRHGGRVTKTLSGHSDNKCSQ